MLRICVAGATGWTGRPVAEAVHAAGDMQLVGAVARRAAGRDIGEAWGVPHQGVPVHATVADALDAAGADVLIDYTSHLAVRDNITAALQRNVAVVVGSSGLSGAQYREIDALARSRGVGVIAAGNFSLTAAMMQAAATLVSRHLADWEIVDYASAAKPDAPSGTARELAERLGTARRSTPPPPRDDADEARGTTVAGTQVHSVRLPGFVLSTEIVFGQTDERLSIRHDAGPSATPYVAGTLVAARAVVTTVGLVRGLDTLLLSAEESGDDG